MRSILTLLLFLPFLANAQYFEVGVFAGLSKYQGDLSSTLTERDDYSLAYGAVLRYNLNEYVSIKGTAIRAEISGDDRRAPSTSGRRERNLNFQSVIYEGSLVGEFNVLGFDITQDLIFSPYVFAGVAYYYHNPKAYLNNQLHALQPLGTEGQGMEAYPELEKYKLYQFSIPVGLGIKFSVNEVVNIGLEAGLRKTFTDYLDDVSGAYPDIQGLLENNPTAAALSYREEDILNNNSFTNPGGTNRGNPENNDWYLIGGLSVTFNLGTYY